VTVIDTNDNAPVFREPEYTLEIPENAQLPIIHTVLAMDNDVGANGQVQYSIVGE